MRLPAPGSGLEEMTVIHTSGGFDLVRVTGRRGEHREVEVNSAQHNRGAQQVLTRASSAPSTLQKLAGAVKERADIDLNEPKRNIYDAIPLNVNVPGTKEDFVSMRTYEASAFIPSRNSRRTMLPSPVCVAVMCPSFRLCTLHIINTI